MKHVTITPVFNEEKYLEAFILSMIEQENRPQKFILVDDNSTDNSAAIIKKFCKEHDWIKYIHHPARKKKSQGAKVVRAFNFGINKNFLDNIDIISKIDADLQLPRDYFSEVIKAFEDEKIGLTGGYILEQNDNQQWVRTPQASYHIRGALKSYRIETFKDIGGLMPVLGWDGLDEMKAFYNDWESKIIDVGVKHFRPASKDYDNKEYFYKKGIATYKNGSNFFLMIIRSLVRVTKPPIFIVSFMYLYGYLKALFNRAEKNVDKELSRFINRFHYKRLLKFKRY